MISHCESPLIRIEKIKKNQIINPGSSPYNQMPQTTPADNSQNAGILPAQNMTPVMNQNGNGSETVAPNLLSPDFRNDTAPDLLQNAPSFTVPANPLLPEGYQEILDYNALQYANGFYRTQIGRFVRVEQLMGSNTIETREGYLIGVGLNYILLQEMSTGNIQVIDFYGIKTMYVYYNYGNMAVSPRGMGTAETEELPKEK